MLPNWSFFVGPMLVAVLMLVISQRRTGVSNAVQRLSTSTGLAVAPELDSMLKTRVRFLGWGMTIGCLFACSIGLAIAAFPTPIFPIGMSVLPLGFFFVGLNLGAAAGAIAGQAKTDTGSIHVARLRATTVADYTPLRTRVSLVLSLAIAAGIACVVFLQLTHVSATRSFVRNEVRSAEFAIATLIALAIVSATAWAVGATAIVRRRQNVATPTELAWDDALRAHALNYLAVAGLIGPMYLLIALFISVSSIGESVHSIGGLVWGVASAGFGVVGLAIVGSVKSPQREYLRRLWPTTDRHRTELLVAASETAAPVK